MKLRLFREAIALNVRGKVELIGTGRHSIYFNIADVAIELRVENNMTLCTCKQCSIHGDKRNLLCSYKLAAFYYLFKNCVPPKRLFK